MSGQHPRHNWRQKQNFENYDDNRASPSQRGSTPVRTAAFGKTMHPVETRDTKILDMIKN